MDDIYIPLDENGIPRATITSVRESSETMVLKPFHRETDERPQVTTSASAATAESPS